MGQQSPLQRLMNKPLDRKEFLQHSGLMLLTLFGVTQLVNHLLHTEKLATPEAPARRWGNGKFGV